MLLIKRLNAFVANKGKARRGETANNPEEDVFKISVLLPGLPPKARQIFIHSVTFGNVSCKKKFRIIINGRK